MAVIKTCLLLCLGALLFVAARSEMAGENGSIREITSLSDWHTTLEEGHSTGKLVSCIVRHNLPVLILLTSPVWSTPFSVKDDALKSKYLLTVSEHYTCRWLPRSGQNGAAYAN